MQDINKVERLEYIDFVKGAAMMLVVFGHMGDLPYRMVFTFHMPLFFLLSGYFMKTGKNDKKFVLKKARRLLLPYIFTAICMVIIHCMVDNSVGASSAYDLIVHWIRSAIYGAGTWYRLPEGIEGIGAIWFLLALFWAFIFTKIILKLNKKMQWRALLLLCGGCWASTYILKIWLPFSLQAGGVATGYVFLGYKAKEFELVSYMFDDHGKLTKTGGFWLILSIIVWLVEFKLGIFVSMARNYYGKGPVSIVGSIIISYGFVIMSLLIEKHLPEKGVTEILKIWGKNSLIILCFHLIEMTFIPYNFFFSNISNVVILFITIYTTKIVLLSAAIFICARIKILRYVFCISES